MVAFAGAVTVLGAGPAYGADGSVKIDVLSNRADVISAGDALVELKLADGVDLSAVTVTDDGTDITASG